ncbi:hypothetical protein [uncultured Treponema sp.]|uniref:hypothetical protein n=1 Tax=uncultured Treponema sp. TaxID=162155 RepID=UPI0025CDC7CF|nr:hypothetical protein [uncultured Treponema sp.]
MKKKIVMGLFVLAAVVGMGFAETKSSAYYKGYNKSTSDYSEGNAYNPSYCNDYYNKKGDGEKRYDCTKGYQDSWKDNSNVAPKSQIESL